MLSSFLRNKHLEELYLDNNQLYKITNSWFTFKKKLRYLDVSHNKIQDIEENLFKSSKNILLLNFSHNKLDILKSSTFQHLSNLTYLYLHNNQISYVSEHAFNGLSNLVEINMSNNSISLGEREFDTSFKPLVSLTKMDLSGNHILMVPSTSFLGLSNLLYLDLRRNDIRVMETNAFSNIKQLKYIFFNVDQLICDCSVKYLRNWIILNGFQHTVTASCSDQPLWLDKRNVLELLDSELICVDSSVKPTFRPKVVVHPFSKYAFRNGKTNFSCIATSAVSSPMHIYWYHGNRLIQSNRVITSEQLLVTSGLYQRISIVVVRGVQKFEDAGSYWCHVANIYGSDWSISANLTVVVRPHLSLDLKTDIVARSGDDIFIPCTAEGEPTPVVHFTKKFATKPFPAVVDKRLSYNDHQFGIQQLKIEDSGDYLCTAKSSVGIANATIKLTVIEEPKFTRPMRTKTIAYGKVAVLDCIVSGSPTPYVTWYKNGQLLEHSKRLTLSNQLLVLESFVYKDEGIYECKATNRLGTARQSAHLTVDDVKQTTVSSKLPTEIFITVVIVTVIAVIILTSLVWTLLLCYCRKKRREKIRQQQENELANRYAEESLLCRELPKHYTLRYHGNKDKTTVPVEQGLETPLVDSMSYDRRAKETLDSDYFTWSRDHQGDIELEDDSGVSLAYPKPTNQRAVLVSSTNPNANRFLSLYKEKPFIKAASDQQFKTLNLKSDILHNKNELPNGSSTLKTQKLSSNETLPSQNIDYDPTRLKRTYSNSDGYELNALRHDSFDNQVNFSPTSYMKPRDDYVTSSSGVESGNSTESLNYDGILNDDGYIIQQPLVV